MVRQLGIGGCERDLAKMALHLDRSRFEPHVGAFLTEGLRTKELREAGVPIVEIPMRSFLSLGSWKRAMDTFGAYVQRHGIRLVHSYDVPASMFTAIAGRRFGLTGVISSQLSYRHLLSGRERALLRITDRLSHRIVVNSKAVQQHLVTDCGVSDDKIFLCYNGVEPTVFYPATGAEPRPDGLADASLVIGIVAALRPEKQIDTLLRAFARVAHLQAGMRLLIVGSGPEREFLRALAAELGIVDATMFVPAQSEVAPWMRAIDIFVQPSRSESFPNALVEAMFCGCCAVGSAVGGIPELLDGGRVGLMFRPGDTEDLANQFRTLIEDQSRRQVLMKSGCEFVHRTFSMERAVRRTELLYGELLEPAGNMAGVVQSTLG